MRAIFILIFLLFSLVNFGQFGESIRSGRPGQAIGAFTLGEKVFQLQTGYSYNKIDTTNLSTSIFGQSTVLRFGILERFEISGVINWQTDKTSINSMDSFSGGISNTQLGARINLLKNKGWIPTLCIQGRVLLTAQSKPYQRKNLGSKLIIATSNRISDKVSLTTNWGSIWKGNNKKPTFFYILNFSVQLKERLSYFAEIYGDINQFTHSYDTGFAFLVNKDFQLDFSSGWQGDNNISDWFVDFGISWRIDWRKNNLNTKS